MSLFRLKWAERDAYRATFWRDGWRREGKVTEDTRIVLKALSKFCRANTSCVQFGRDGRVDPYLSAAIEGRREVFLEIQRVLHLTDEELLSIKGVDDE